MGLRGDWFKVATCAVSTAIRIATCGRPDVADVKKLQRVPRTIGFYGSFMMLWRGLRVSELAVSQSADP